MAPELLKKRPFDGHAVDIWAGVSVEYTIFLNLYKMSLIFFHVCVPSAGTILLFMLTGKRLQNPPLVDRAFDNIDLSVS